MTVAPTLQASSPEPDFCAEGGRRPQGDSRSPRELVSLLQTERRTLEHGWLQLVDARAVAGSLHLASAIEHAARARRCGRAHFNDPGAELTLYLSGTDQWDVAVARVGLSADTIEVVLIASPAVALTGIWDRLRLRADPAVFPRPASAVTLGRLGYSETELQTLPAQQWELLALEAVALVDLPRATPSGHRPEPA